MSDFALRVPHTFKGDIVNGRVVERKGPLVVIYPYWPLMPKSFWQHLKMLYRHQGFVIEVGRRAYVGVNGNVLWDVQWCRLRICWQRGFREIRFDAGPGKLERSTRPLRDGRER